MPCTCTVSHNVRVEQNESNSQAKKSHWDNIQDINTQKLFACSQTSQISQKSHPKPTPNPKPTPRHHTDLVLGEPSGDECQHSDLAGEGFGRSDSHFTASIQVDTAVGHSGQQGTNGINDLHLTDTQGVSQLTGPAKRRKQRKGRQKPIPRGRQRDEVTGNWVWFASWWTEMERAGIGDTGNVEWLGEWAQLPANVEATYSVQVLCYLCQSDESQRNEGYLMTSSVSPDWDMRRRPVSWWSLGKVWESTSLASAARMVSSEPMNCMISSPYWAAYSEVPHPVIMRFLRGVK